MPYPRKLTGSQIDELASKLGIMRVKDLAAEFDISPATVCKYREMLTNTQELTPRAARIKADRNGDVMYHGRTCKECHTNKRYTKSSKCVNCHSVKAKRLYEARKSNTYKKREEYTKELIAHHKQNPQFSCVRWG